MNVYSLGDKKPQLPPEGEYWLAPTATLIGDVILKPGASVWFGASQYSPSGGSCGFLSPSL